MSYSYKVGNNGPTLEVDDAIKTIVSAGIIELEIRQNKN